MENLVHEYRVGDDWEGAVSLLRDALLRFEERGIWVSQVAACDLELSRELGAELQTLQFDTVVHKGGNDRADRLLLDQLRMTPKEAFDTLVIGSGDDIFSDAAAECVRNGKRVEVIAIKGKIGANLYRMAHDFHPLSGCEKRRAIYSLDNLPIGLVYGGALPFSLYQRYRPRG